MIALNGVMFCAVDGGDWHGAAGCGEVDVSGALTPGCACAACEGVCDQCAIFVAYIIVKVAHAGFLQAFVPFTANA